MTGETWQVCSNKRKPREVQQNYRYLDIIDIMDIIEFMDLRDIMDLIDIMGHIDLS